MSSASGHLPRPETILANKVHRASRKEALCDDYAEALVEQLGSAGLGSRSRIRFTCLTSLPLDCHTVVELQTEPGGPWMMLDPTFALAVDIGGRFAGVEDLARTVRGNAWSQAEIVALGDQTSADLEGYHMDYPLLFLNPVGLDGPREDPLAPVSPLPYLETATLPLSGRRGVFLAGCLQPVAGAPGAARSLEGALPAPPLPVRASLIVDGVRREIECQPPFNFSASFWGTEVGHDGAAAPPLVYRVPWGGAPSARVRFAR